MLFDAVNEWLLDRFSPKCPVCRRKSLYFRLDRDRAHYVCSLCGSAFGRRG